MFRRFSVVILAALCCQQAQADVALGAGLSTLGFGLQGTIAINPHLNLRLAANGGTFNDDFEESGIQYKGEFELSSYGLIADIHPFAGSFYLSAGYLGHDNSLALKATCPQSCDIDGQSYQSSPDGQINSHVDFGTGAPYLGIGWGNAMQGGRLYAKLDIGVLFQDKPKVDLTATGSFKNTTTGLTMNTSNPIFQKELANEEKSLQQEINDADYSELYPVIGLSIGYRF
ncbi:hypothetical protein [Agitococcus lubricus]|uniref:Outer membrane protein n=1 Tax=Agitococcus lubricus TaxID=1077255 RepID=A0A2T5J3B6_9GAMM|nr:hypothetical protein [Agitococcus lubricus]PTQ91082.1 hypothetical protein C8N29_101154 [Agitococcus lubricus]